MAALQFIVAVLIVCIAAVEGDGENCINTIYELKESFQSRRENIDSMQNALMPTNGPAHVQVVIYYHYNTTVAQACANSSEYSAACDSCPIDLAKLPYDFKFRWSSTSVHNFIRPQLLEDLSLYTYRAQDTEAHVLIDEICSKAPPENITRVGLCREHDFDITSPGQEIKLLNEFTARIKTYSLSPDFDIDPEETHGYSALFVSCTSGSFDIVYKEPDYQTSRTLLHVSLFFLSFFIAIGTPHLIVYMYNHDSGLKRFKRYSLSSYFVWGVILMAMIMTPMIVGQGIYTIIVRGYSKGEKSIHKDVQRNYILGEVILGLIAILALFSILSVACKHKKRSHVKGFPVPNIIAERVCSCVFRCFCSHRCCQHFLGLSTKRKTAQLIGIFFFTVWVNYLVAHALFIVLALFASPIPTISSLLLFCTAIFFTIVVFAFTLKRCDTNNEEKERKQHPPQQLGDLGESGHTQPVPKEGLCSKLERGCDVCSKCIAVVVWLTLLAFVDMFVAFIFITNIHSEQYNRSSYLATVVTTLVPSSLVAFLGYIVKGMVEAEKEPTQATDDKEESDHHERDKGEDRRPDSEKVINNNESSEEMSLIPNNASVRNYSSSAPPDIVQTPM